VGLEAFGQVAYCCVREVCDRVWTLTREH
jgi:hypothetical protein